MPATAKRPRRRLSERELMDLLELTREADSVELKLTVPESARRSAMAALGMDPLDAQIRQVYFFDTPDLTLDKQGLVVRARRVQGRGDDTVVKLRPVVPDKLPAGLRQSKRFVVEVDAMPGGYVCSASLKGALGVTDVKQVAAGQRPIRKLFSKQQRAFFTEHAPEGVGLDDLSVLGPVIVFKLKWTPQGYDRRMVAELWMFPDNSRILELSTKCAPPQALEVALQARAFLSDRGMDLSGEQQTKTRTALQYFSSSLEPAAST
ncbi:MAG TPA: adenylate cyclase [Actinomycetes bacterium]|nr:adenylate cyclase [Actinomycetes bacterium]